MHNFRSSRLSISCFESRSCENVGNFSLTILLMVFHSRAVSDVFFCKSSNIPESIRALLALLISRPNFWRYSSNFICNCCMVFFPSSISKLSCVFLRNNSSSSLFFCLMFCSFLQKPVFDSVAIFFHPPIAGWLPSSHL